jgi:hypothetical protein
VAPNGTAREPVAVLVADADAAWARCGNLTEAKLADRLYTAAAAADPTGVAALMGALRAKSYLIEHEPEPEERLRVARAAVDEGQWCLQRAPADVRCHYRLAIALGQQAREDHATALDAMRRMTDLLKQVIATDPSYDGAGAHRVLALLYLRAPAWPLGPGDPEAALTEAQAAVTLFPGRADNRLAYAEALAKTGREDNANAAYTEALAAAERALAAGDRDAPRWVAEAKAALAR